MHREARPAWAALTVLAGGLCLVSALTAPILLLAGRWGDAVMDALFAVGAYWFAAGAWLRTPWGHVDERTPPPAPPPLSARHAELAIAAAGICVIACVIALGLQALAADL